MDESLPQDRPVPPGTPPATGPRAPLSIGWCVRASWAAFWRHPWLGLGMMLAAVIVSALAGGSFWRGLVWLAVFPPVYGGIARLGLNMVEDRHPAGSDLLRGFKRWWDFLLAYLIVTIAVMILCIPIVVPLVMMGVATTWMHPDAWATAVGVAGAAALVSVGTVLGLVVLFLSIRIQFVFYLLADSPRITPLQAIRKSWEMTRGSWWRLFGLTLVLLLIQCVGALCLLVGLLVTLPMLVLGVAAAYVHLRPADLGVEVASPAPPVPAEPATAPPAPAVP